MNRRAFLATIGAATTVAVSGCLGDDSGDIRDAVTRESITATEPDDDDELDLAELRYVLEDIEIDVIDMEARRLANVGTARLRLTYRSVYPAASPTERDEVAIFWDDTDPAPNPVESITETAYGDLSNDLDGPDAEIVAVTMLFGAYVESGDGHDGLDVTVTDEFEDMIYTYNVDGEWTSRWTDGPAQYEEVHERVMDTFEE